MCESFSPKYEISLSVPNTNIAPRRNPNATGKYAYLPSSPYIPEPSAISIAGARSDQNEAAIITPAANPKAASSDFR